MSGEHNILREEKGYSSRKFSMPRLVSMFYLKREVIFVFDGQTDT